MKSSCLQVSSRKNRLQGSLWVDGEGKLEYFVFCNSPPSFK